MSKELRHHFGHHKELVQEGTSKRNMSSLNTYQRVFSRIPQKMNPKRKRRLSNF
jgi:hypothetical protein